MILFGVIVLGLLAAWIGVAIAKMVRHSLGFRQALLYAPLAIAYRIDDRSIAAAREANGPVIYAVSHQSWVDPALMLSLLPDDTLHILDEDSARSAWLEPWREMARTIAFNAEHVFVSRRLVRHLRGKGKLAVYFPPQVEPDPRTFRLYRAVARIATAAGARIVPIHIGGAKHSTFSRLPAEEAPRRLLPRLRISALPPKTLAEAMEGSGRTGTGVTALFDMMAEARLGATDTRLTLPRAIVGAARATGMSRTIIEDPISGTMSYGRLLTGIRILAHRFAARTDGGEIIGVLLPSSIGVATTFFALLSAGRVPAMINFTAGPASAAAAVVATKLRTVVSSRSFVEKGELEALVEAMQKAGAEFVWLEDLRQSVTTYDKIAGTLFRSRPLVATRAADPAVILFTSGSEGVPKGVALSHRNLIANAMQAEARIGFSAADTLFNVLPVFHSFGLLGGLVLPLLAGVRLYLYPTPLHYKIIPQIAAKTKPTIMFGTDTFLAGYARAAKDTDFASLRLIVAGAEPVRAETRRAWRERFGAEIVEGFGLTEASPVVAVNTATHGRDGTVGRFLPGLSVRLEPVEGISDARRLWVKGPNIMLGYLAADRPGELQRLDGGWHDTGDIVSIDREGFVTIRGRAKRFAKIAGEMVSLGVVEMLVQSLWPEQHHAVVAVPDKRKGERIVLVTTADAADRTTMLAHSRARGATELMVPADVVKVVDLPILGSGKIDYPGVRRLALNDLGLGEAAA